MKRALVPLAALVGLLLLATVALANVYDYAGPYRATLDTGTPAATEYAVHTAAGWGVYAHDGSVVYLRRSRLSGLIHGDAAPVVTPKPAPPASAWGTWGALGASANPVPTRGTDWGHPGRSGTPPPAPTSGAAFWKAATGN